MKKSDISLSWIALLLQAKKACQCEKQLDCAFTNEI